jgi:hypothetical protein
LYSETFAAKPFIRNSSGTSVDLCGIYHAGQPIYDDGSEMLLRNEKNEPVP